MNRVCIIGAGKTGRGFIARLLQQDNREILFIDNNRELVDTLNINGCFKVRFFNNEPTFKVSNYSAATWDNADLDDIDLIFVSVGGSNLTDVGINLSKLLKPDKRYYIIVCENAKDPARILAEAIGKENVSVSESTVFCTTIEDRDTDILSEHYPFLQYDSKPFNGYNPKLNGLKGIDDFQNFLTRKLYTYNSASCIIAYLGYIKGYTVYSDAANDKDILELLDKNYRIINRVLCKEYGYDEKEQEEFADLSREKFLDRNILDTIERNAREPHRKLVKGERVIGPLELIEKYGEDTYVMELTIAAMLLYDSDKETKWRKIRVENTMEQILTDICGLQQNSPVFNKILDKTKSLKEYLNA